MLASLRDATGATTVDGLDGSGQWTGLAYDEADFRRDAKVLDGVELIGTGTVADRLWARPAVTVLGIDAPAVVGATPSVQAAAGALVSVRLPPGLDAGKAADALTAHLRAAAPWGAKVEVTQRGSGQPFARGHHQPGVRGDGGGDARGVRPGDGGGRAGRLDPAVQHAGHALPVRPRSC